MSDLTLHGVLNQPLPDDPAELDVVTWVQFRNRARDASAQIARLTAERNHANDHADAAIEEVARLTAEMERNAAIALNAIQRATLAEEWRDHDKDRAERLTAERDAAWNDALEAAAREMKPMLRSMISRGHAEKAIRALKKGDSHE